MFFTRFTTLVAATTAAAAALVATGAQAQSTSTDIPEEIAQVLADFQAQGLISKPVDSSWLNLSSALTLSFGGTNATTGQSYTLPSDTSALTSTPEYQLDIPADRASYYAGQSFTAMLVDPGAAGYTQSGSNVTRHYLANNLKVTNGVLTNSTAAITSYNEPGPAAGSGAHRYLALVFDQGSSFVAPSGLNTAGTPLANMTLSKYISDSKMGGLVAMNFILVENTSDGTKTFSSTAAPASSTVAALASSIASSLSDSTTAATTSTSSSTATKSGSSSGAQQVAIGGSKVVATLALIAAVTIGMTIA